MNNILIIISTIRMHWPMKRTTIEFLLDLMATIAACTWIEYIAIHTNRVPLNEWTNEWMSLCVCECGDAKAISILYILFNGKNVFTFFFICLLLRPIQFSCDFWFPWIECRHTTGHTPFDTVYFLFVCSFLDEFSCVAIRYSVFAQ